MSILRTIAFRMRALFQGRRLDLEMEEEMRFHLEMQAAKNREEGASADEARHAALRQFGGVDQVKETCRDSRGVAWLEQLVQDTHFGFRVLCNNPGFTTVAVLSLALGIGANSAIFCMLNAVLWRSLPVRDPQDLRAISWTGHNVQVSYRTESGGRSLPGGGESAAAFSYPTFLDFRNQGAGFSDVFAYYRLHGGSTVVTSEGAIQADGMMVSGNFFVGYGAQALVGRTLQEGDDQPGAPPAAVITYRMWERRFGLDPEALGRSFLVNGLNVTVVGILPREFAGPVLGDPTDFYVPMAFQPQLIPSCPLGSYHHWWVEIMARMAPGGDERQAAASLDVLFKRTLEAPGGKTRMDQPHILLEDGSRGPVMLRERFAQPLYILWAAVALVLLIACANIAGLMLARGAARQHEFAVRASVGAGSWRLVRQLLTESLLLSSAGAALGLLVAAWIKTALPGLASTSPTGLHLNLGNNTRVLVFTCGTALATVLLFGLFPALKSARIVPLQDLKRPGIHSTQRLGAARILVASQVGLSLVLLIGAGLFVRTFANLIRVDPGFDTENLLIFRADAGQAGYRGQQLDGLFDALRRSLAALPGTRSAAYSSEALLSGNYSGGGIKIVGRPVLPVSVGQLTVSDSYLATMGIPLLLGRNLDSGDTPGSLRATVVNESFARTFFSGENPLGRSVMDGSVEYRIVGICRDVRYDNVRTPPGPMMFLSFRQSPPGTAYFEVRSTLPTSSLVPAARRLLTALDRNIPMTDVQPQSELISRQLTLERVFASLCSFTALLALLLSSIGLYGLLAYGVERRTNEIGVRIALGATPGGVAVEIVRGALAMVVTGAVLGAGGAFLLARIIRGRLYGIEPTDPATLGGSVLLLLFVALLSAWIPALRAARTDPLKALRAE